MIVTSDEMQDRSLLDVCVLQSGSWVGYFSAFIAFSCRRSICFCLISV